VIDLRTLSVRIFIAGSDVMISEQRIERDWKEAVVAYFDLIISHLPGRTEENHDTFCQVATLEAGI
jgi:hypothetical protein